MPKLQTAFALPDATIAPCPILPDGWERDGFIRLFQAIAKPMFGLNDAEILSFTMMVE